MTQEQTEAKIIKVAVELFLEKGKEGTKTWEIAEKAGINKALLHYYFRSKDNLYKCVLEKELSKFFMSLSNSFPEEENFEIYLKKLISLYVHNLAKNPQITRFMIWEIGKKESLIEKHLKKMFLQNENSPFMKVRTRIEDAQEKGLFRKISPDHLIISIIGLCVFPFIGEKVIGILFPDLEIRSEDFIIKRSEEIFQLVWNGIRLEN